MSPGWKICPTRGSPAASSAGRTCDRTDRTSAFQVEDQGLRLVGLVGTQAVHEIDLRRHLDHLAPVRAAKRAFLPVMRRAAERQRQPPFTKGQGQAAPIQRRRRRQAVGGDAQGEFVVGLPVGGLGQGIGPQR